jgi:hypothetical protein
VAHDGPGTSGDFVDALTCKNCGKTFAIKEKHHAGFSDVGFLYCDRDSTVLTFSAFDPEFERVVGCRDCVPWQLEVDQQERVENALIPCPSGGRFQFRNPLRCPNCGQPLAEPMRKDIYYYVLDARIDGEKTNVWNRR